MKNIFLLGAVHEHNPQKETHSKIICGSKSDILLKQNWFQALDDKKTLLITEGGFNKTILSLDSPTYENSLFYISKALFETPKFPAACCGVSFSESMKT
jgi:hypothetical protein